MSIRTLHPACNCDLHTTHFHSNCFDALDQCSPNPFATRGLADAKRHDATDHSVLMKQRLRIEGEEACDPMIYFRDQNSRSRAIVIRPNAGRREICLVRISKLAEQRSNGFSITLYGITNLNHP